MKIEMVCHRIHLNHARKGTLLRENINIEDRESLIKHQRNYHQSVFFVSFFFLNWGITLALQFQGYNMICCLCISQRDHHNNSSWHPPKLWILCLFNGVFLFSIFEFHSPLSTDQLPLLNICFCSYTTSIYTKI